VIFRPGLSIVFGLVLAASLSFKVAGLTGLVAAPASAIPHEITALLEQHDFQVAQHSADDDLTWVSGNAPTCKIRIAEIALQGWHQSLVAQIASGNQLFYLFEGQSYSEQPVMRTRAHYYWRKLNRYIGLHAPTHPVLAVIANPGCENLPLSELAELSGR
jgi:hypothetical protein